MKSPHPSSGAEATLISLLPGLGAATLCFGVGVLLNLGIAWLAVLFVTATHTAFKARDHGRAPHRLMPDLRVDRETLALRAVSATIIAFALPPASLWWVTASAAAIAALYAGLARDARPIVAFNPAMLAVLLVLLVLPQHVSDWPRAGHTEMTGLWVRFIGATSGIDGSSGATALIAMANRAPQTISEIRADIDVFGAFGGAGYEWLGLLWCCGGIWLCYRRVIGWTIPLAATIGSCVAAALYYDGDGAFGGATPLHHLLSGGTLLMFFFVLTEPHTAPAGNGARVCYGLLAGVLLIVTRENSDGVDRAALVVLLMNALAPVLSALRWPALTLRKAA